jgi:penicillin-binding protein 2A
MRNSQEVKRFMIQMKNYIRNGSKKGWQSLSQHRWLKYLTLSIASVILLSSIGFFFIIYGGGLIVDEKKMVLPATTTVVTEDGTYAGRLYTENRLLTTLSDVPEHVLTAFIATEDERFYSHAGVDFRSVLRAVYKDIIALDKVEGASTITQQLSKNLFLTNEQSWMRKTKEVMASMYLERNYSKNDILELYLNQLYFAHGVHGIETASQYFFSKSVSDLTITEGALLAGMIKGPNIYSPYISEENAVARRNVVLNQMHRVGYLETEELLQLQGQGLGVTPQPEAAPAYIDDYLEVVIQEIESTYNITRDELQRGGYRVTVYMDPDMQKKAYEHVNNDTYYQASNDEVEASVVIVDIETAGLKAVIGGRDYTIGQSHHQALTKHQPGSTIKPLAVYTPALENGYHPYTLLSDEQKDFDGYMVSNANNEYIGDIPLVDALAESKNTTAVSLLNDIGIDTGKSYLDQLNLSTKDDGLAIALGGLSSGYSPIQMATAYNTYLNEGVYRDSSTVISISDRNGVQIPLAEREEIQVFEKQSAWYTLNMLERVVTDGTASRYDYSGILAGKTGSTQHPSVEGATKDAWFVGLTPDFTVSTWIGFDQSDDEHYLTKGSSQAVQLTKALLTDINQANDMKGEFVRPSGVEDLPEPIILPEITDLNASFSLGGFNLLRAELTWSTPSDERIIYHVYEVTEDGKKLIGKTTGEGSYTIKRPSILQMTRYYVEPINPLTNQTGELSNPAMLSLFE